MGGAGGCIGGCAFCWGKDRREYQVNDGRMTLVMPRGRSIASATARNISRLGASNSSYLPTNLEILDLEKCERTFREVMNERLEGQVPIQALCGWLVQGVPVPKIVLSTEFVARRSELYTVPTDAELLRA